MRVTDVSVYHYSVDVLPGEFPDSVAPVFGPPFRPAVLRLQLGHADGVAQFTLVGPTVDVRHPSGAWVERRAEGWAIWDGPVPDRALDALAEQLALDADHLRTQADFLSCMAHEVRGGGTRPKPVGAVRADAETRPR